MEVNVNTLTFGFKQPDLHNVIAAILFLVQA
jgi:hypothetical protein